MRDGNLPTETCNGLRAFDSSFNNFEVSPRVVVKVFPWVLWRIELSRDISKFSKLFRNENTVRRHLVDELQSMHTNG